MLLLFSIPSFRLLISLGDMPMHKCKEPAVRRAVSSIGTYLGSVAPQNPADFREWMAVVATDNLMRVPENVTIFYGGMEYTVPVKVLKIMPGLIYKASDLPDRPPVYTIPDGSSSSGNSSEEDVQPQRDDEVFVSKKVLQEICQGRDIANIPEELQPYIAMSEPASPETMVVATQTATPNAPVEDPTHQILQRSLPLHKEGTDDPMIHEANEAGQRKHTT